MPAQAPIPLSSEALKAQFPWSLRVTTKRVWDVYTLWTISPTMGLRLLGSNLDPRDYITTGVNGSTNLAGNALERTTSQSFSRNYINWQLRLELKL